MRRLLTTALALGLAFAGIAPAAADDGIGLSTDGTQWADTISEPLFEQDAVWVPGDKRTVSFHVRNQESSDAELTASVRSDDTDRLLGADHLRLRARVDGRWFVLRNGVSSPELTAASISPGSAVRVDLEAAFDPASSNASQAASLDFVIEVRLAEAVESTDPEPGGETPTDRPTDNSDDSANEDPTAAPADSNDPDGSGAGARDDSGDLARTGSDTPAILIWTAILAITAGAAFIAAGRREREDEPCVTPR